MNEKMIIDAYCRIRTIDNTISDDVLDFMKDAAIEKLNIIKVAELKPLLENEKVLIFCGDRDWIGIEATVKRIKPNGDCEIHSSMIIIIVISNIFKRLSLENHNMNLFY